MQNRTIPTVSVVMPAYNAEKYLREAIESILSQTFTDFELIIINDGSTDRTKEIILSYDDPRIVYIENEQNSGICITLNKGLEAARGRYIARMDSDDISMPERLAKQVEYMDTHPEIGVSGTDIEVFGEGLQPYVFNEVYEPDMCSAGLLFNPCFAHPTVIMRGDVIRDYGLRYDDEFKGLEDLRMWWEFAKVSRLSNLPAPLLRYRRHQSQETRNVSQHKIVQSNKFRQIRFESFGIKLTNEEKQVLNAYSYGEYNYFGYPEFNLFCNVMKRIRLCKKLPILSSKKALHVVMSKAVAYIITQSSELRSNRKRLITEAFIKGLVPPIWYCKYIFSYLR